MSFSLADRPALIHRLRSEIFDLLVVGGGITGAGIARDAALRGLKVALIERGDFAVGTSSRSTKLIHGGLRYLEMGDVRLVFEAVRERQRLLRLAPHLARPQSFILPVFQHSKHSVFVLDVGLTVYDALAAFAGVVRHRAVRKSALLRMEPLLKADRLSGGIRYFDAMTDDSRLVVANVRGALQAGAVPVTRVSFLEPVFRGGRLVGAKVRDEHRGETLMVAARVLVGAVGPWTDELMARWRGQPVPRTLRPAKGVHIVVPRARLPLSHAVTMTAPSDGRVVFALPWPHATVLGTTDTTHDGPLDEPGTTVADAQYLLDCANANLNPPDSPLTLGDVVSTWSGIRPLVASEGQSTYKTSREHVISTDPRGLVTIAGGKLTTYRVMAAETVDTALKLLPPQAQAEAKPCATDHLPLPGATDLPSQTRPIEALIALLTTQHGLDPEVARHLAHQYGGEATAVLDLSRKTPRGAERVLPDLPVLWGEIDWIAREEMPLTLVDLAVRRTWLYYLAGDRLLEVAIPLAERLCEASGQPKHQAQALADELRRYVDDHHVSGTEAVDAA